MTYASRLVSVFGGRKCFLSPRDGGGEKSALHAAERLFCSLECFATFLPPSFFFSSSCRAFVCVCACVLTCVWFCVAGCGAFFFLRHSGLVMTCRMCATDRPHFFPCSVPFPQCLSLSLCVPFRIFSSTPDFCHQKCGTSLYCLAPSLLPRFRRSRPRWATEARVVGGSMGESRALPLLSRSPARIRYGFPTASLARFTAHASPLPPSRHAPLL